MDLKLSQNTVNYAVSRCNGARLSGIIEDFKKLASVGSVATPKKL